jgi:lipopolysaccharide/colanic/teichoic acid biosynthesis glycosyltransferase
MLAEVEREGERAVVPSGGMVYLVAKRLLDVVLSLVLLALLAPLLILTAVVVKITSRGPVMFSQTRAGKRTQPFTMYKFRTMRLGAEDDQAFLRHMNCQNGPIFKVREDPRLTWPGRFLRRSSIDELLQLFNVLKGEMSLVGPRPLWLPEAQKAAGAAKLRTSVKPGLTCLWQISGRSELSYEQMVLLDLYYIRHRSFMLDLMIIIQTLPAILSGHGAY